MALLTSTNSGALSTTETGPALIQELVETAVAFRVAKPVYTGATEYHFPVVQDDPSADFVAEGAEISLSDANIVENVVIPRKLAGLSKVSRELTEDNQASSRMVIDGLVRDLSRKVDSAFFGALATPAPAGLESLSGINTITTPSGETAWVDLDVFAEAIADARSVTAEVRSFVANPADALALDQLKQGSGSNVPLLGADPTAPTSRSILGVPLYTSSAVTAGTVWGIPQDRVHAVIREDAVVETSRDQFFTSDSVAIKATTRVAFAYPHEVAIQKVMLATA